MLNSDLLPSLLFKINQNQLALEAAIMELANWVEQRGSSEVADNVRGALDTISHNEQWCSWHLSDLPIGHGLAYGNHSRSAKENEHQTMGR